MASRNIFMPGRSASLTKAEKKKKIDDVVGEVKAGYKLVKEKAADAELNPLDSKAWKELRAKHNEIKEDLAAIEKIGVENSDKEKAVKMRIEDCAVMRKIPSITKTGPRVFSREAAEAAVKVIISNADGLAILKNKDVTKSVRWLVDIIEKTLKTHDTSAITKAQKICDARISTMERDHKDALAEAQKKFDNEISKMHTKHEQAVMAVEGEHQDLEESRMEEMEIHRDVEKSQRGEIERLEKVEGSLREEIERLREVETSLQLRISTSTGEHNQALEGRQAKYNVLDEEFEETVKEYEEKAEKSREREKELEKRVLKYEEEYTNYRSTMEESQLQQSAELDRAINRGNILSREKEEIEAAVAMRVSELKEESARLNELAGAKRQVESQLCATDADLEEEKSRVKELNETISGLNQHIDTLESEQEKLVGLHNSNWITMGKWCREAQKGRSDALGRLKSTNKAYAEEVATITHNHNMKTQDHEAMKAKVHELEEQIKQRDQALLSAITWVTESGEKPLDIQQVEAESSLAANLLHEWILSPFSNIVINPGVSSFQTGTTTLLVDGAKLVVFQQQPLLLCIVDREAIKYILLSHKESTCMMKEIEGYEKVFPIVVKGEESTKFDLWLRLNVWNASKPSKTYLGDILARMASEGFKF